MTDSYLDRSVQRRRDVQPALGKLTAVLFVRESENVKEQRQKQTSFCSGKCSVFFHDPV